MTDLKELVKKLKQDAYTELDICEAWEAIEELDTLRNLFETDIKLGRSLTPLGMLCHIYELEKMRDYKETRESKIVSDYEKHLGFYKEFVAEIRHAPMNQYSFNALIKLGDSINEQL